MSVRKPYLRVSYHAYSPASPASALHASQKVASCHRTHQLNTANRNCDMIESTVSDRKKHLGVYKRNRDMTKNTV